MRKPKSLRKSIMKVLRGNPSGFSSVAIADEVRASVKATHRELHNLLGFNSGVERLPINTHELRRAYGNCGHYWVYVEPKGKIDDTKQEK